MKIGIFTAMKQEAESFLQNTMHEQTVGQFSVYTFPLGKHEAVLCCPPNVGEIAASAACQLLISEFNVDAILNFGIVGALTKDVALLSTVFVGSVVHYDFDVSAIDDLPVGRYSHFDDVAVGCDENILQKALSLNNLPVVRCASADKFVGDTAQKAALNANFGAEICDMESAGILFACKYNNIPCLLVKRISDSLEDSLHDYETNAKTACEGFFAFAQKLAESL